MNLTEEIIARLKNLGFTSKVTNVIRYFISENIKEIFGTEEFDKEDIDLTIRDKELEIKTIFTETQYIIKTYLNKYDGSKRIQCYQKVDNKPYIEFEIVTFGDKTGSYNYIENNILVKDLESEKCYIREYEYDRKKDLYKLTLESKDIIDGNQIIYSAFLQPMYTRCKNEDWFTFKREMPNKDKDKSFLKSIVDSVNGKGDSRRIITSNDVLDFEYYVKDIFDELKSDASEVLNPKNKANMKRVRN